MKAVMPNQMVTLPHSTALLRHEAMGSEDATVKQGKVVILGGLRWEEV